MTDFVPGFEAQMYWYFKITNQNGVRVMVIYVAPFE